MVEPTLNETLASHGLTTRPTEDADLVPAARSGKKDILDGDRVVLWSATAADVWEWLRTEALVCPDCGAVECASDIGEHYVEDLGEAVQHYECECGWAWVPAVEAFWAGKGAA